MKDEELNTNPQRPIPIRAHITIVTVILMFPAVFIYVGKTELWKIVILSIGLMAAYGLVIRFRSHLLVVAIVGVVLGGLPFWAASAGLETTVTYSLITPCILVAVAITDRNQPRCHAEQIDED